MVEALLEISENLKKDYIDYLGIILPILLSFVAILISMWNSFWVKNIKKLEANLVWDDLFNSFFIIIRNTGYKTLVIKKVSLYAYDKGKKEKLELGTRDNVWALKQEKSFIKPNEAITLNPIYGSLYDVFAYRGHYFDVNESNKMFIVKLVVTDIDNREWSFETNFKLEEIENKLNYASTID